MEWYGRSGCHAPSTSPMQLYTNPRLLDVQGARNVCPAQHRTQIASASGLCNILKPALFRQSKSRFTNEIVRFLDRVDDGT